MRYLFISIFLLGIKVTSTSQNIFLDLYHPFNVSSIALQTDSLQIITYDTTKVIEKRFILYHYQEDNTLPPDRTELRKTVSGSYNKRITEHTSWAGKILIVESSSLDSNTLVEQKKRFFKAYNESNLVDSSWVEYYDEEEWKKSRKTLYKYTDNNFLENFTEMTWVTSSNEWKPEVLVKYTYNDSGRLLYKTEERASDSDWKIQNTYRYDYSPNDNKSLITVWYGDHGGNFGPIDSLKTWYNETGLKDSSILYLWDWYSSQWEKSEKKVFNDQDQKITSIGNEYLIDNQLSWRFSKQSLITPGDQIFTNEPKEIILSEFDPVALKWRDTRKKIITYQYIDSIHVHGTIETFDLDTSTVSWRPTFSAEAWFKIIKDEPEFNQDIDDRSSRFQFSYTCDLPNPYVRNMTITFPETSAAGNFNLAIFSTEGRLVFERKYNDSGIGYVDAPLQPGVYWVTLRKGSTPLCTQKLIVN